MSWKTVWDIRELNWGKLRHQTHIHVRGKFMRDVHFLGCTVDTDKIWNVD